MMNWNECAIIETNKSGPEVLTHLEAGDRPLIRQHGRLGILANLLASATLGDFLMLTEEQKAYLAGLIDGEGCIFIAESRGRYFQLKVVVAGTIERHIKACADMVGLGSMHHQPGSRNTADKWQWHIASQEAKTMLQMILPYMILKTDQARLGIRFQKHIDSSPGYGGRRPIPRQVLKYRRQLADLMKDLKKNEKVFSDGDITNVEIPEPPWKQPVLL